MKTLARSDHLLAAIAPPDPSTGKRIAALGVCAGLIEAGLLAIRLLGRPADHVPEYISFYLLLSVPYVAACWLINRDAGLLSSRVALRWIWAAALLFRFTVLPLHPSLSEDAARYRWQGVVQDVGGDPYVAIPADPKWEDLRDETWDRVSTKGKPSAYGPVLELLNLWCYRLAAHVSGDPWAQVWLFKLPFVLADLLVGLALMSLLAALGRPRALVLIYLWSPLAVTEFWIEGHNDAVAVVFAVAALTASQRGRKTLALALLGVATMCKFWPVVLVPHMALSRNRIGWRVEWKGLIAAAGVGLVLCLPYMSTFGSVLRVLAGLMGGWRNNDSLFALFVQAAGGNLRLATCLTIAALVITVGSLRLLQLPTLAGELASICALLFLSANCFPWYLTWMLPLLAVHPVPALLLWTALVALAYHVVPAYEAAGLWRYDSTLTLAQYVPVLCWLVGLLGQHALRLLRIRRPSRLATKNQWLKRDGR